MKTRPHLYTKIPALMQEVQDVDDVRGWVRCVLVIEMVEVTATLRYIPKGSVNELN